MRTLPHVLGPPIVRRHGTCWRMVGMAALLASFADCVSDSRRCRRKACAQTSALRSSCHSSAAVLAEVSDALGMSLSYTTSGLSEGRRKASNASVMELRVALGFQ
eukprot:6470730-Amphidinium_carterae.3